MFGGPDARGVLFWPGGGDVAAHQIQMRFGAAARRSWAFGGASVRSGLGGAGYAWAGYGMIWASGLLPVAKWQAVALGAVAAGLVCGLARARAAMKEATALKRFAEAARRGLDGDWEGLAACATGEDLREATAAVQQLLSAGQSEWEGLQARVASTENDARRVMEDAARRIAALELRVKTAAQQLREPALTVHAVANLLTRDSGSRLDALGRERLEQLRASAEAIDERVRDWIGSCLADESAAASGSTLTGVVTGGDNGGGAQGE